MDLDLDLDLVWRIEMLRRTADFHGRTAGQLLRDLALFNSPALRRNVCDQQGYHMDWESFLLRLLSAGEAAKTEGEVALFISRFDDYYDKLRLKNNACEWLRARGVKAWTDYEA